jgi:glycosyltransferase involved in cell wall biosynthesis
METRQPTRVLIVTGSFATKEADPWLVDDLVEAMVALGALVDVLVHDVAKPRERGMQPARARQRVFNVGPERSSRQGMARLVQHVLAGARLHLSGSRFVCGTHYDLCVYFSPAFLSAGFPSRLRRRGTVDHLALVLWDFFPVHHGEIGRLRSHWVLAPLKAIERSVLRRADTITVMSPRSDEFLRQYHHGLKAETLILPPWGGTSDPRLTAETKLDEFTAVFGGQLTAGRGVETLLGAAEELFRRRSGARILIIGSGSDRARLQDFALAQGLENVTFIERVDRDAYLQLIQRAHIGIAITVPNVSIPSYPSKIVDYFRVSLPAVVCLERSSDVGALIEAAGAGISVEAGDAIGLARAIETLNTEWLSGVLGHRGERAKQFYCEYLSASAAASAMLTLVPQFCPAPDGPTTRNSPSLPEASS